MANLKEQSKWETGIYQIEENDPVLGGEDGITNKPANQLANRTKWLKEQTERLEMALNNYIPNSKKSSAVNSPSNDTVATSAAAKIAYDKALDALKKANEVDNSTLKKNGNQELNGILTAKNVGGAWAAYNFATNGGTWRFEAHPDPDDNSNRRLNLLFTSNSGNGIYLRFPHVNNAGDTIAYQRWVDEQIAKVKSIADSNTRSLNNYITKSKKSNATNSVSSDTVATSFAVKTTYDLANTANENANGRVSKTDENVLSGSVVLTQNRQGLANQIILRNNNGGEGQGSGIGFHVTGNTYAGGIVMVDDQHKSRFEVWTIPTAGNGGFGVNQKTLILQGGNLWIKNYGWLHDKFHHNDKDYVIVKEASNNLAGLHINLKNGNQMRLEANNGKWKFWKQYGYSIFLPEKDGTVALTSDLTWNNISGKPQVVSDIRLGAATHRNLGTDSWDIWGQGCVITGFHNGPDDLNANDKVFMRPIQKYINGAWVTIANA